MGDSKRSVFGSIRSLFQTQDDCQVPPRGLKWRSNTLFIIATVGVGLFTDLFLYGLIVPVLPFILEDRVSAPTTQIQSLTSTLLAVYAGASVISAPIAGFWADRASSRQLPFLFGLTALLLATVLLYVGSSVPVLIIARILQGVSGGIVWTVGLALLCHDTVGPENLGKVLGTIFSSISVASLLGPLLGGILYEKTGYEGVFGLGAALLVVDLAMRCLVIEKRFAEKYNHYAATDQTQEPGPGGERAEANDDEQSEETPLLPEERGKYRLPAGESYMAKHFPLVYCFRNSSLVTAFVVALVQAVLLGAFDSTIPLEAKDLFEFNSLKAGVLFIPLSIGDLLLGPLAGWLVDRFGTKLVGTTGFGFLVPVLVALRVVDTGDTEHLIIYCALLVLCGVGLAFVGAPSIVEAGAVVQKYHKANPELFPEAGPYGQLYGVNCVCFSAGLTVGPLIAGSLRTAIGYGNMNAVVSAICLLTAIVCFVWLGGRPRILGRKL